MRILIEHNEDMSVYLTRNKIYTEYLNEKYKVIDIKKKYLPKLQRILLHAEPDFGIRLYPIGSVSQENLDNTYLLITIGAPHNDKGIDAYYDMTSQNLSSPFQIRTSRPYRWIHCSSSYKEITATDFIKCFLFLKGLLQDYQNPVMIYSNAQLPRSFYSTGSLACKIIQECMENINGILISKVPVAMTKQKHSHFNPILQAHTHKIFCTQKSINDSLPAAFSYLNTNSHRLASNLLFQNNYFYDSIDDEQEIYVPLNIGNLRTPDDYRALGVEFISLFGDYGMLYAKKKVFDSLSESLRPDVIYPYFMPVLSSDSCHEKMVDTNFSYQLPPENLEYKGKGIYIGVISSDPVDYTHPCLRSKDGKTRIAYIWSQKRTDDGNHYYKEQIDTALESPNPSDLIELPETKSTSTLILGIAGGECTTPSYKGVATEAEFLAARINTAPISIQNAYGGTPSKYSVIMPDILIGALKLINFAAKKQRPLVLCIPFNSNIDSHDAKFILNEILDLLAIHPNVTIIVPAGNEADKRHHYSVEKPNPPKATVQINVRKENQNLVGIFYQKVPSVTNISLYPPLNISSQPINIGKAGSHLLDRTTIYTNGYNVSYINGAARMIFRLNNPQLGIWRIVLTLKPNLSSQTDIWISQQELNEFITLEPSDPFITVGSLGNIRNVITVGAYDENTHVVLNESARGPTWDGLIKPDFVAHGNDIIAPCANNGWSKVSGTIPAASIIAGATATIYNKCVAEKIVPIPNTVVMNTIFLSILTQFEGIQYPNSNYGYGSFDLEILSPLLKATFLL